MRRDGNWERSYFNDGMWYLFSERGELLGYHVPLAPDSIAVYASTQHTAKVCVALELDERCEVVEKALALEGVTLGNVRRP